MILLLVLIALLLVQFDPSQIMSSPVVAAVLALIALVGDSFITALLARSAAKGLKPQTIVYFVSGVIVLAAMYGAGVRPPIFDMLNPAVAIGAIMVIIAGWAEATKFLYDILLRRFWPAPATPETPTPPMPPAPEKNISRPL